VVEEYERAYHAPLCKGQDAPDLKAAADIAAALVYDEINHAPFVGACTLLGNPAI